MNNQKGMPKKIIPILVAVALLLTGAHATLAAADAHDDPADTVVVGEETSHAPVGDDGEAHGEEGGHHADISTFLWIAVLLVAAKLSSLIERIGQPAVLGELLMGVFLGNAILLGIPWFEAIRGDAIISFLAEFGVILLLFTIGLESNISEMRRVGKNAFLVAVVGVVAPFVLGTYIVGPWLLPGLSSAAYLFLGAALTATSVGITARVFQDLGKLQTTEAKIVLGAAVFDDVFGLIILAIVSAIATVGAISGGALAVIVGKALVFLIGAIVLGQLFAPRLSWAFSRIHTGVGMKFTLAVTFMFVFAYLAKQFFGLEAIIGAFAAGLVLDPVHFDFFRDAELVEDVKKHTQHADPKIKEQIKKIVAHHSHKHIEDLMQPLVYLLVPLFFVRTGMDVDLRTLAEGSVVLVALVVTLVAFFGKYAAGIFAGDANKHIVGIGMVPRGEVGLIFAAVGRELGVVSGSVFSVIVIMVIITTLMAPPLLTWLLNKPDKQASAVA